MSFILNSSTWHYCLSLAAELYCCCTGATSTFMTCGSRVVLLLYRCDINIYDKGMNQHQENSAPLPYSQSLSSLGSASARSLYKCTYLRAAFRNSTAQGGGSWTGGLQKAPLWRGHSGRCPCLALRNPDHIP